MKAKERPGFDVDALRSLAGEKAFARGEAYHRGGQVEILVIEPNGTGPSVASHQLDVFLIEPGSDRYLGRLCSFSACPKGKRDCLVPGCGAIPFNKIVAEFTNSFRSSGSRFACDAIRARRQAAAFGARLAAAVERLR